MPGSVTANLECNQFRTPMHTIPGYYFSNVPVNCVQNIKRSVKVALRETEGSTDFTKTPISSLAKVSVSSLLKS